MADLRERLIAASLVSETFRATDGKVHAGMNTNTEAADRALAAVVEWLRETAAEVQDEHWGTGTSGPAYVISRLADGLSPR
jgi:hypothetical protein